MLTHLRQYIIKTNMYCNQGILLKTLYIHSKNYRHYLTEVLDGLLHNLDVLIADVPDLFNVIGFNWHIGDVAGFEQSPYEDPDLIELIADCIDPNAKSSYRSSYDIVGAVREFVLGADETPADKAIAECIMNCVGLDYELEDLKEKLSLCDEEEWSEQINSAICEDSGEYIDIWKIVPSSPERRVALSVAFDLIGIEEVNGVFWNVGMNYGDTYDGENFSYEEMANAISDSAEYENCTGIEKYSPVFNTLSSDCKGIDIINSLGRKPMNRKDVLF